MTAAGTAGLTYGLCKALGVSQTGTSVGAHLQRSAIQTGVSTGFNIITQDQSLGDALLQGLINIGANTAGGLGANTIGDIYIAGDIDALTHKALHALLGALVGAAANREDPGKGALGGAIGAVGAELVAENLSDSMEARTRADIGRAAGTVAAVVAGQDGNAALLAGTNAVENNFGAPHYSPDPEAAQQEMREETQGAQIIADAAGTKAPGFSEANEAAHSGVEALFDFYDNVPFIEYAPPPIQIMRHMRAPVHMGVDFVLPDTVGGVVLLAAGGLAGKAGKVPAVVEEVAVVAVKEGRKLISEIAPYIAKAPAKAPAPGARNLPALDLAEKAPPKKAVTFKSSGKSAAKPAVKPTPATDVEPKSILKPAPVQKPASSMQRPSTSYERTSSQPASSTPRSPQAPSTAPPVKTTQAASSSSQVIPERKVIRGKDGKVKMPYTQKHHVIHEALKEHELWKLAGRDPQTMSNIMVLPTKRGAELSTTKKSIHQGRHTDKSRNRLEIQMHEARDRGKLESWTQDQYSQALDKIIEKEREALRKGDRILNKNKRPLATDQ